MLSRGEQQVFELSQSMRANNIALVVGEIVSLDRVLVKKYVEVIEPEVCHHFLKLALAEYAAQNFGLLQLILDDAKSATPAASHHVEYLAFAWREIIYQQALLWVCDVAAEHDALLDWQARMLSSLLSTITSDEIPSSNSRAA